MMLLGGMPMRASRCVGWVCEEGAVLNGGQVDGEHDHADHPRRLS